MPFVTRDLFSLIRDRADAAEHAAVPLTPRGPQPLCAAFAPSCLPAIEAALRARDLRVIAMLGRLPSVDYIAADDLALAGDPERLFFNVNDASDLETAERVARE